ncbi:MAG TPA: tagaturonate reductase [Longimicrobiaceae bacterium]|nr:tagaturonate reductase [Longimicrobiaceae bacterium]
MPPTLDRALASSPAFRARPGVLAPAPELLDLPEKAVQFGTGAFLRGFVEHFLDAANRGGRFGGRVVMVGSTGSGRDQALNEQDGLYALATQGIADGEPFRELRVVASASRALSSRAEWERVLELARSPELELVFSNTTEVGIVLDGDDRPDLDPPRSFPGKLARFLLERGRAFGWAPDRGVVVLPCELIEDNGGRLREIVLELAERWGLEPEFARWVRESVPFCDTLVDRIVPGAPEGGERARLVEELGCEDALLTVCEPYRLFAIQGDDALRARLGFADADPGVVVTPDVAPYRERKVRLLNGAHSAMVAAALLSGCDTVREAVEHERVGPFLRRVLLDEIVPSLDAPGAERFAAGVLDRFANPYVRHALADITLQHTMKLRVRVVPSVLGYARRAGRAPAGLAFAFAAYLLWARGGAGERRPDDQGGRIRGLWGGVADDAPEVLRELARAACADAETWGADLAAVPGFAEAVGDALAHAAREGVPAALEAHLAGSSRG